MGNMGIEPMNRSKTYYDSSLFSGPTWNRTKIDGLTVHSNKPLYDRPVYLTFFIY